MSRPVLAALAAAAVVAAMPSAGTADASAPADTKVTTPPVAWQTGVVRLGPDPASAWVTGRYRCKNPRSATEMWVSARQSPGVGAQEDVLGAPLAIYDGRLAPLETDATFGAICDGRWHAGRVPVAQQVGTLGAGVALVQWCLRDTTEQPVNSTGYVLLCTVDSARVR